MDIQNRTRIPLISKNITRIPLPSFEINTKLPEFPKVLKNHSNVPPFWKLTRIPSIKHFPKCPSVSKARAVCVPLGCLYTSSGISLEVLNLKSRNMHNGITRMVATTPPEMPRIFLVIRNGSLPSGMGICLPTMWIDSN